MNLNYYQQNPKRLYSPLLDGNKEKREPDNNLPEERNHRSQNPESKTTKQPVSVNNRKNISIQRITFLESVFKLGSIFILSVGGLISILELVNVIRIIYSGSENISYSLISLGIASVGTTLSMIICLSIIHLVKSIKYIYLNLEDLNSKLDYILKS